jgi:hypothetical protein
VKGRRSPWHLNKLPMQQPPCCQVSLSSNRGAPSAIFLFQSPLALNLPSPLKQNVPRLSSSRAPVSHLQEVTFYINPDLVVSSDIMRVFCPASNATLQSPSTCFHFDEDVFAKPMLLQSAVAQVQHRCACASFLAIHMDIITERLSQVLLMLQCEKPTLLCSLLFNHVRKCGSDFIAAVGAKRFRPCVCLRQRRFFWRTWRQERFRKGFTIIVLSNVI